MGRGSGARPNRAPVAVGFRGYAIATPLSVAILVGAAAFFVLGAVIVWFGELRQRRRASRAERRVRQLEEEVAALRAPPRHDDATVLVPAS